MKFAVLASNSFTGAHLVNYLLEMTDDSVVGISRSPQYSSLFLPYLYNKSHSKRFSFYQLDIVRNTEDALALLDSIRPDYLINFAAQGEVRSSWQNPEHWYLTNCVGIARLSQGLLNRSYLKKYVAASTPEVYGTTQPNLPESCNYNPSTPYAVSKLAGDLHLLALFKRYDFPVCLTRSANVYGIHQQLYRIIPKTIITALLGERLPLHGGGKALRAFVHARDVADATFRVCLYGTPGEVYHIAPKEHPISIAEVTNKICDLLGKDPEKIIEPTIDNYGQDAVYSISAKKIKEELGWEPRIGFTEGLQEVIDWIRSNWEQIRNLPREYRHIP